MSITPPAGAPPAPPLGTIACPRCGEALAADQDWCLRCGDPARTVVAAAPRWRRPILALVASTALALGVLAAAFLAASSDDPPPARTLTTVTTLAPGVAPPPGVQTVPAPAAATPAPDPSQPASGATAPATPPATTPGTSTPAGTP